MSAAPVLEILRPIYSDTNLLTQSYNDYGNAMRVIAMLGEDMRYCHAFRSWLIWTGTHWQIDRTDQARKRAQDTMLEFARQALEAKNDALSKFAGQCLNSQRITSALREAEPHLAVGVDELDTHADLLNCENGTVDLRNGTLRSPKREDLLTKYVAHRYNPDAMCPTWHRFLSRILPGLEDYLQVALGYSLSGVTSEKVIFICHGGGNNGKSTLLSTIHDLLGNDYGTLLQIESLTAKQLDNNAQSDLADLRGMRFVMTSETKKNQALDESKLKRICQGMGKIRAVRKYENPFEFRETHKLWLDSNHKPAITGSDNAIWNRLHLIPFDTTIPPDEIDQDLPPKLLAEAEGILVWCVKGASRWYRDRLKKPDAIQAATAAWRQENDDVGMFVKECCVTGDQFRVRAKALHLCYHAWMQEQGKQPLNSTEFGNELRERKFEKKTSNGVWYLGIALRAEGEAA